MSDEPPFNLAPMLARLSYSGVIIGGAMLLGIVPRLLNPVVRENYPVVYSYALLIAAMTVLGVWGLKKLRRWAWWFPERDPETPEQPILCGLLHLLGGLCFLFGLLIMAVLFVDGVTGGGGHAGPALALSGVVGGPALLIGHVLFWSGVMLRPQI